jgi:hypothetical protein
MSSPFRNRPSTATNSANFGGPILKDKLFYFVALGYTRLLGANLVIDARLGLSRTKAGRFSLSIGNNAITIPGLPSDPTVSGGLPSTSITGFTSFGRQSTNPQCRTPP